MTHDVRCAELAEAFLADCPKTVKGQEWTRHVTALANRIQETIEYYIEEQGFEEPRESQR